MKKIYATLLAALLLPAVALAETRVAVVDPLMAIFETSEAKKRTSSLESDMKGKEEGLARLRKEIMDIEEKLKKEGMTMSEGEQKRLTDERDAKMLDFRSRGQLAQKRVEEERKELLEVMEPKFRNALEALAQEKGYDIIVTRQAALYVKEEHDITRQVTQKIDQMK